MSMNEEKYKALVLHVRKHQEDPGYDPDNEVREWLTAHSDDPIGDYLQVQDAIRAHCSQGDDSEGEDGDERVKVVITCATVRGHCCPLCGVSMGDHEPDYFVVIWGRGPMCDQCARRVMPDYHQMLQTWREWRRQNDLTCDPSLKPDLLH